MGLSDISSACHSEALNLVRKAEIQSFGMTEKDYPTIPQRAENLSTPKAHHFALLCTLRVGIIPRETPNLRPANKRFEVSEE